MAISGKYNFQGIQKMGRLALKAALASSPMTSWILKGGRFTDALLDLISNWFANNGLIFLNVGAFRVGGKIDQVTLDNAIDNGIKSVENSKNKLTPQQIREIDNAVMLAARKAFPYSSKPYRP